MFPTMGGASGVAGGQLPPVPYALPPAAPGRRGHEKNICVPSGPFPSIVAA